MTQEFVTLPREVVEQAVEALFCTDSEEGSTAYKNELEAVKKLRAALEQPQESPYGECDECGTEYSFDPTDGGSICVACLKERLKQPQCEQEPVGFVRQIDIEQIAKTPSDWGAMFGRVMGFNTVPVYTHPQPKLETLTDNQIDRIAESMPGGLEGFLKGWGWRQFARAVLENDHNIK